MSNSKIVFILLAKFVLLIILAACNSTPNIPSKKITLGPDAYLPSLELEDGQWLMYRRAGPNYYDEPQYILVDSEASAEEWEPFELPDDPRCERATYIGPYPLPENQLGFVQNCILLNDSNYTDFLMAYDRKTQTMTRFMEQPFYKGGSGGVHWDEKLDRGVVTFGSGLTDTIHWVTREGPEPITSRITHSGESWRADRVVDVLLSPDYDVYFNDNDMGNLRAASWSPDGKTILLWATPGAFGEVGMDRIEYPSYLFELDPITDEFRLFWDQAVYNANYPAWHPTEPWIVFGGHIGFRSGIWLLNVETKELLHMKRPDWAAYVWTRDGDAIITTECADGYCYYPDYPEKFKYDVSDIVNSP